MKRLLLLIVLLFSHTVFAADKIIPPGIPKEFFLQLEFFYSMQQQSGYSFERSLQSNMNIQSNHHEWVDIAREESRGNSPLILLLAKLENVSPDTVSLKFFFLSLGKNSNFISEPQITLRWGQPGEITLHQDNQQLRLVMLASRKNFCRLDEKENTDNTAKPAEHSAAANDQSKPRDERPRLFHN